MPLHRTHLGGHSDVGLNVGEKRYGAPLRRPSFVTSDRPTPRVGRSVGEEAPHWVSPEALEGLVEQLGSCHVGACP